jgi:hypothetical protein
VLLYGLQIQVFLKDIQQMTFGGTYVFTTLTFHQILITFHGVMSIGGYL